MDKHLYNLTTALIILCAVAMVPTISKGFANITHMVVHQIP